MPRNMSFFLTTKQIKEKTKFVTRRLGWWNLNPGEIVNACEKCQGLKKGEKINRLCQIRVVTVRVEPLDDINQVDVILEGFPDWTPGQFVKFFAAHNKCAENEPVNRIEFEYLD